VDVVETVHGALALHGAGTHGHADIAKMLIDAGADPDLNDKWGNSFRDLATAVGGAISPAALKVHLGWDKAPQRTLPPASAEKMVLR